MGCYLVTGGAGFIGAAVARRLLDNGHEVDIIDNLSTGSIENLPEGSNFIEGDCGDKNTYSVLSGKKYEAVYHIAGQSSGEISFENPVYDLQTNTQSTLLLLQYAKQAGITRFLYASSMSVYGEQPDHPVNETAVCIPKSFYGVGKLASEHYIRIYQQYGIESTALRLFNVYGPGQNMKNMKQGMVSIYLAQAVESENIIVKGSSDRYRDFIYIEDVVDAFVELEQATESYGKIYNVASSRKTHVKELLALINSMVPEKKEIVFNGSTPGDQHGIYASIDLIKNDTGWSPGYSLKEGLKKMTDWLLLIQRKYLTT